ncbi:hypothetical protein E3A20_27780 [Planctomyces bekefii]|uniref:Protein CR006 P-loop domain-containing protein n=1 Tax=Planctomyces bekefii TaxID=1653850 RepID=A0A5C6M1P2_9PLAN|nr:hypothetical protein E3A20_27780 [Planctomyces bekefii]
MRKLKINLKHCYGIKSLKYDFDFSTKKTYSIYAPNGSMKTSFAKTFQDFSLDEPSEDLVFSERTTIREIKDENDKDLDKEQIFVIKPYDESFYSDKVSTLLVNKGLKDNYDEIHRELDLKKEELLKLLSRPSGIKKNDDIQNEICRAFFKSDFFEVLEVTEIKILNDDNAELSSIVYSKIFNEKVIEFLEKPNINSQIKEYIEKFNELLESSPYLNKKFNHSNASTIQKTLKENGFFGANHSINLLGVLNF